jgi:hypothetical protein
MTAGDSRAPSALGFLTMLEHEQHGLVGGYLILNTNGRPIEFHCTAPIKANRAQQILFGPTLDAYLYGEQIGQTLLAKCSLDLLAVCTDVERALCVRDYASSPVALVVGGETTPDAAGGVSAEMVTPGATLWRVDAAQQVGPHLNAFAVGHNRLAVPAHCDADQQVLAERLEPLAELDLSEPFERIRQAIEEAHKSGRAQAAA